MLFTNNFSFEASNPSAAASVPFSEMGLKAAFVLSLISSSMALKLDHVPWFLHVAGNSLLASWGDSDYTSCPVLPSVFAEIYLISFYLKKHIPGFQFEQFPLPGLMIPR